KRYWPATFTMVTGHEISLSAEPSIPDAEIDLHRPHRLYLERVSSGGLIEVRLPLGQSEKGGHIGGVSLREQEFYDEGSVRKARVGEVFPCAIPKTTMPAMRMKTTHADS
ncbi:hypothetical protein, partial [Shinella sp.]|uniref:hypothetical protein n=1 Tax=Shinella sp. TaxID=1870904 RepID=UPI00289AD525